jgi:hypothetical protein
MGGGPSFMMGKDAGALGLQTEKSRMMNDALFFYSAEARAER